MNIDTPSAMSEKGKAEPASNIENRLRALREERRLSQGDLARRAGITRQAVYAIENNQYLPTTAVALRLAGALSCRVEDLFSLITAGEVLEGDLIGASDVEPRTRVKVARIGDRVVVRPVVQLGDVLNFTVASDGLVLRASDGAGRKPLRVRVELTRDRRLIDDEIVVAGCDPSIFLVGEYLRRRREKTSVVGWTMGSAAALDALKRQEVHVAGLHVVDDKSGESNLPYLRRHLKGDQYTVVTFAAWQQGLMVLPGNPKTIRDVADLARKGVRLINREEGAGARLLLDRQLKRFGIVPTDVRGYDQIAASHLDVARAIKHGQADAGVGVSAAAKLLGLDFLPIQDERYDLVIPTAYIDFHPSLAGFLDTLVSRPFRTEIAALGGYDTRETGKVHDWHAKSLPANALVE